MPPTKAPNPPAAEQAATEQAATERAVTEAAPVEPAAPAAPQFTHRITAVLAAGFCRAGRRWYHEATAVNRDDFSDEQWAALEAEPMLVVVAL